jgi:hypothetical protein
MKRKVAALSVLAVVAALSIDSALACPRGPTGYTKSRPAKPMATAAAPAAKSDQRVRVAGSSANAAADAPATDAPLSGAPKECSRYSAALGKLIPTSCGK